jgi:ABC-type bacteriocin/lantibiotic exporter with double-glycine peptidase domain
LSVRLLVLSVALLVATACSPFQRHSWTTESEGLAVVPGVPFIKQTRRDDCGASALAILLAHRGIEAPLATIDAAVYTPVLRGSFLADLENFARGQGASTRSGRGNLELLRTQIDAGRPVLVLMETGLGPWSQPHYLVVFGFDEQRFLVHAGVAGGLFIDVGELDRRWSRMNRLYLYLD